MLNADTFALSVAGDFDVDFNGTITTNALNLNVGGDFSNNDASSDFVWGANDTLTVLGSADITTDSFNNSGTIAVSNSSFDITAASLNNSGTISANTTLNTTVSSIANNSFTNTGGVLNSDTFALSVAGDFDYTKKGTITTNAFNLQVGGDFSNNDSANDFTWGANDTLTVLGSADITTDSFNNSGTIAVSNSSFDITAASLNNSGTISANTTLNTTVSSTANNSFTNTGGVLNADTFALSVAGDFDYVAEYLNNGTITTNAFNLTVGGDFSNNDAANDLDWGANDTLTVLGTASVTADSFTNRGTIAVSNSSFDITATDFTNSGTISANSFNTTVSSTANNSFTNTGGVLNADTFALSVAGDFDYVADFNGTITTNALNLNVGGDFSNNDASSDFVWGANDTLTVLGSADITTDSFNNSGTIAVSNSSFDITAASLNNSGTISANTTLNTTVSSIANNSFTNTGGVLNSDTFALSVAGDFDYTKKGTITTNAFNLQVGGDFSNNDSANDFTWGANDTLTVLGSADITTDSFNNSGTIAVSNSSFDITAASLNNSGTISTDSFEITAGYTVINQGSIASDSLDVTTDDFFRNLTGGEINVATLNITAGGKVTNTATIDVSGILSITANNDSARTDDPAGAFFYVSNRGNITAGSFTIEAVDNFYNRGNITTTSNFTTSAKSVFLLNEEIDSFYAAGNTYDGGTITLGGTSGLITDGGIVENYGNIDLGGFDLTIVADSFINQASANISAERLNLYSVNSFLNEGVIDATIDQY